MDNSLELDVGSGGHVVVTEPQPGPGPVSDPGSRILEADTNPAMEIPFVPAVGRTEPTDGRVKQAVFSFLDSFRWRRPFMVVLLAAVAGAVVLAATRGPLSDSANGRSTGPSSGAPTGSVLGLLSEEVVTDGRTNTADGELAPEDRADGSGQTLVVPGATARTTTTSSVSSTTAGETSTTGSTATTSAPTSTVVVTTAEQTTTTVQTTTTTTEQSTTSTTEATTTVRDPVPVVSGGGFEQPVIDEDILWLENGEVGAWNSTNGDIQLNRDGFEGIPAAGGNQFAELNSSGQGGLYQDVAVQPGDRLDWEFWHRGRSGTDTLELQIGSPSGPEVVFTASTGNDGWVRYSGSYTVPPELTVVRVLLWSTQGGSRGNLIDRVSVVSR